MKVHPVDALLELAKRFNLGELDGAMLERWRVLLNTPDAAQAVKASRAEPQAVNVAGLLEGTVELEQHRAERAILASLSKRGLREALEAQPLGPPLSLTRHGVRFAVARSVCPYSHPDGGRGLGDSIPRPAHVLSLELGLKWAPHAGMATISLACGECRRVSERRVPLEWTGSREEPAT